MSDHDRFGIGWRTELASGILANLAEFDVLELVVHDETRIAPASLDALRALGRTVPITVHGVSLGLASSAAVERARLERIARLVDAVRPESWSEHLAFVRAGGREVGHLAAPPRTQRTTSGLAENVTAAARVIGAVPQLENIATLIDAPGSDRAEAEWVVDSLRATGAELLLDLHNLHANATNFGFDPIAYIDTLPPDSVRTIHLAGGRPIEDRAGRTWVLDDHRHDVPDPVYGLLAEVAARTSAPLTVILERDGEYPAMPELVAQLRAARRAVAAGRQRRGVAA